VAAFPRQPNHLRGAWRVMERAPLTCQRAAGNRLWPGNILTPVPVWFFAPETGCTGQLALRCQHPAGGLGWLAAVGENPEAARVGRCAPNWRVTPIDPSPPYLVRDCFIGHSRTRLLSSSLSLIRSPGWL